MDVTRLRILTYKSRFNFGKFADLSVHQALSLGEINYVRWVYYNIEKISYMEEILDRVGITAEFRIPKPGKNQSLFEEIKYRLCDGSKMTEEEIRMRSKEKKHQVRMGKVMSGIRDDKISTPIMNQSRNQKK
jgi:hypothetical protein